ncbi:hypothetical protein ACWC3X_44135, partial [Streptomyces populi]
YEAGVLTLRVPIAERAKPRRISVRHTKDRDRERELESRPAHSRSADRVLRSAEAPPAPTPSPHTGRPAGTPERPSASSPAAPETTRSHRSSPNTP